MRRLVVLLLALTIALIAMSNANVAQAQNDDVSPPAEDQATAETEDATLDKTAQVVVVGSVANQLTYTADKQEFTRRVVVESQNNVDIENLKIFTSFINAPTTAGQVNLNCFIEPISASDDPIPCQTGAPLPALGALTVRLSANLPVSGDYTGGFSLLHDQTRQSLSLTVQRAVPPLPIAVHAVETAQTMAAPFWQPGEANAIWWLTLQETSLSEAITLNQPAFLTLSRLDSNQQTYQAERTKVSLNNCDNNEQQQIPLNPGQVTEVKLAVCGLNQAGRYTGQLMLSAEGYQPLQPSTPVIILVREHWWRAILFIALGVFVSFGIRSYQSSGRLRLVQQRQTLDLIEEIEAKRPSTAQNQEATAILDSWLRRLNRLLRDLKLNVAEKPERVLTEITHKLPIFDKWLLVLESAEELVTNDAKKQEYQTELNKTASYLRQPATNNKIEDNAQAQLADLDRIQKNIREEVTKVLQADVIEENPERRQIIGLGISDQLIKSARTAITQAKGSLPDNDSLLTILKQANVGTLSPSISNTLAQLIKLFDQAKPQMPTPAESRAQRNKWLGRQLSLADAFVQIAALLVTVFAGTLLLWGNNLTWGGTSDYAIALLWGLGLHQITGTVFENAADLTKQILNDKSDKEQQNNT